MDTGRWQRIEEIFNEALSAAEGERPALLDRSCGGDGALRDEVATLLGIAGRTSTFLDPPAPALLDRDPQELVGRRIGSCRLLRLLAEGGMGAVYAAEQEPFGRRVAVKVLRRGYDGPEARRRFEQEARLLAHLVHPGIAQVFEAGSHEDPGHGALPYLVMELVEDARDLTTAADALGLDLRRRAALVAVVCDAVHHGHTKGVIHRDLKPANILVDGAGRPKVIDFGVARAMGSDLGTRTLHTAAGMIVGTIPYMSPEHFSGNPHDVDVRSDVYSLGVVLYRLLCGRPPYEVAGLPLVEAAQVVTSAAPARPSKVRAALRGDLETILLVALEKDRTRRYASAAALADDIRRFLDRRPILARPPSPLRQVALFARRRKAVFGALVAATLALVLGVVVSLRFAWLEQAARAKEARERARAEALFAGGRNLASWVIQEHARSLRSLSGSLDARRALVSRLLAYLDDLDRNSAADAGLQEEIAAALVTVARLQGSPNEDSLGLTDDALRTLDRALGIHRALERNYPADPARRVAHAVARVERARILLVRGDDAGLRAELEAARGLAAPVAGGDTPSKFPALDVLGNVEVALVDRAVALGDLEGARGHAEAGLRLAEDALRAAAGPARIDAERAVAIARWRLGTALVNLGLNDDARPHLEAAVAHARADAAARPDDREAARHLSVALVGLGDLLWSEDVDAALACYEEAMAVRERLLAAEPRSAASKRSLLVAVERAGDARKELLRPEGAAAAFRRQVELAEALVHSDPTNRDFHRSRWLASRNLGQVLAASDAQEAVRLLTDAWDVAASLAGSGPVSTEDRVDQAAVAESLADLSMAIARSPAADGDAAAAARPHLEAALRWYDRALEVHDALSAGGAPDPRVAAARERVQAARARCAEALARL